jgi:outer membrane lipoprotein carrier protein
MKTLLALALATSALPSLGQQTTAALLAKKVDDHYNHLQSLEAHYAERYQGMGLDRTETGTLTLRKPGRMRWAYDTPAGKVFLLNGKDAIAYTPGDAQATRFPEKQLDDLRSPLRFLLGHTELTKELDHLSLTPVSDNSQPGGPLYTLSGTPKGMTQRLRTLSLTVDATGQIRSMRIEEIDGAQTTFTFTAIHENIPTTDAEFNFSAPRGVGIVDGTNPL